MAPTIIKDERKYVNNPLTGRSVLYGGRAHKQLLRAGVFDNKPPPEERKTIAQPLTPEEEKKEMDLMEESEVHAHECVDGESGTLKRSERKGVTIKKMAPSPFEDEGIPIITNSEVEIDDEYY